MHWRLGKDSRARVPGGTQCQDWPPRRQTPSRWGRSCGHSFAGRSATAWRPGRRARASTGRPTLRSKSGSERSARVGRRSAWRATGSSRKSSVAKTKTSCATTPRLAEERLDQRDQGPLRRRRWERGAARPHPRWPADCSTCRGPRGSCSVLIRSREDGQVEARLMHKRPTGRRRPSEGYSFVSVNCGRQSHRILIRRRRRKGDSPGVRRRDRASTPLDGHGRQQQLQLAAVGQAGRPRGRAVLGADRAHRGRQLQRESRLGTTTGYSRAIE